MLYLIGLVFFAWVLFFGGAGRLENTVLGYFDFGLAGEETVFIKAVAWAGLIVCGLF
ncbi:hypothetical protein [Alloalcanivorax marinus]|uniref:hypothetical protein n=1 Tax=Alloalcanivorax marinus TaxID=1177169 RepID=UPI00193384E0|nr:hypothetical protein [Alloalcanivorax marinus]MBL7250766.1 hypothetical protein [Alloalcanivorax marinus]